MTFRLVHAAGNMFAGTSSRVAAYKKAAASADVVTYSEASKDHAAIRKIAGKDFTLYDELAIGWDRSKFTPAGKPVARLVMVGGKRGTGGSDKRRRGPNRYGLVIPLRETINGQQWLIATHHAIAKADTSQKWRRDLRAQGFRNFGVLVRDMQKAYPKAQLIVTGDWNTVGAVNLGAGLTEAKTPASYGRLRYDRTQHSSDVRVSDITTFATGLDHKALAANVSAMGAIPTPPPTPPEVPVATSQNGYTANQASLMASFTIPGTTRKVTLRKGAPGQLLVTFAAWFDDHIESVDGGILDDWGYANRPIRGSSTGLSNHASGTALDINAPRHPLGKRGTFTAEQAEKIRAELKRYDGAIRWGGDYKNRADEMHFEIVASPEKCAQVLSKVTASLPTTPPKRTAETPYDFLYDAVEGALKQYGPGVQSGYKARRAFVVALTVALKVAPVPAYRKAK